jgi:hypothetical protein
MQPQRHLRFRLAVSLVLAATLALFAFFLADQLEPLWSIGWRAARNQVGRLQLVVGMTFLFSQLGIVLAAAGLAGALLWRSSTRPDARALAIFLALLAFVGTGDAGYLLRHRVHLAPVLDRAVDLSFPFAVVGAIGALLRFSSLFPRPLTRGEILASGFAPRLRAWLASPGVRWSVVAGACLLAAGPDLMGSSLDRLVGRPVDVTPALRSLFVLLALIGLACVVENLRTAHRVADAEGRRRIHWVLEGVLAATVVLVIVSGLKLLQMATGYATPLRIWYPLAFMLALLLLVLALAFAMFFAGAVDPDLAIRRTAVAGIAGVVAIFVFAGVEQLVQEYLATRLGLSDHLGGVLTGGVVALTFDRVKSGVERRLGHRHAGGVAPEPAPDPLEQTAAVR